MEKMGMPAESRGVMGPAREVGVLPHVSVIFVSIGRGRLWRATDVGCRFESEARCMQFHGQSFRDGLPNIFGMETNQMPLS